MVRTLVTQSRMASLMASFSVRLPEFDADHFRAQQAHARNVEPLPLHVFRAHVNDALQAEARRHGGRGHAVLARAGLGDDAALAHAHREQRLAEAVVDLVRAGVQQVFALDVNARAAEMFASGARQIAAAWAGRRNSAAANPVRARNCASARAAA